MANPVRIELEGELQGHYVVVDTDLLTVGFLEDLDATSSVPVIRNALSGVVVESDLPGETMRDKVRGLKPRMFKDFLLPIMRLANES